MAGQDYTTLVSNDGLYHEVIITINLDYFTEDAGMHYVSLNISEQVLSTYISVAAVKRTCLRPKQMCLQTMIRSQTKLSTTSKSKLN